MKGRLVKLYAVPTTTFSRTINQCSTEELQLIATVAVGMLASEDNASREEQQLVDETKLFIDNPSAFQKSNRAVTFWRLGQVIKTRTYMPSAPDEMTLDRALIWSFLLEQDYTEADSSEESRRDTLADLANAVAAHRRRSFWDRLFFWRRSRTPRRRHTNN